MKRNKAASCEGQNTAAQWHPRRIAPPDFFNNERGFFRSQPEGRWFKSVLGGKAELRKIREEWTK
jgi:hypothetical protein